jgi:flagellar basal-body rod protein FlgG
MLAAQAQSEIIGDNIANINTPGYKTEHGSVSAFPTELMDRIVDSEGGNAEATSLGVVGSGVNVNRTSRIDIQGTLQNTGKATDLALNTPGFFVVQTNEGLRFTRNGQFQLNNAGVLQTADGYAVLGENGLIGADNPLSQQFMVDSDGTIRDRGKVIDRLRIMEIPEKALKREGQALYSANQTTAATKVNVQQGSFETSNVDAGTQMVRMITVMRAYEANQKVIQTEDATLEKAVNEVGKL